MAFDVAEEVAAVLAGDLPRFAVNAPALPPEEIAYLRPFASLTERLAALHSQLFGGRVSAIELDFEGELADHDVGLLVASAIKGLLQPFTEERINAVNARLITSNRGIKVVERRNRSHSSYASLVTVRMLGHEIAGTLLMGSRGRCESTPFASTSYRRAASSSAVTRTGRGSWAGSAASWASTT